MYETPRQIAWARRQQKDLVIGFTFIGAGMAFIIALAIFVGMH